MILNKNITIIITGASDGIGKSMTLRLAKEWVNLAIIWRDLSKLKWVENEAMRVWANRCISYVCDIQNAGAIQTTVERIENDFSHIHVLINNAGVWQKLWQLDEMDTNTIEEIIQTNLSWVIHMTHRVLPYIRKQKEGIILNVVSKSGVVAQEWQSVYTATKYGIFGFTEVLKKDLKDSNIRVAGVYQSGTNTSMFRKVGDDFNTENFTEPTDLANAITYILKSPPKMWIHDIRIEY